ncbi:MAG: hypothetical protein ACTS73_00815 [Arsenophonus sp. NEOnobi-MAG3]
MSALVMIIPGVLNNTAQHGKEGQANHAGYNCIEKAMTESMLGNKFIN